MSTYRLDRLFTPRSIAVVGGSPRATSPGRAVLKNLRSSSFAGSIHLVNPHYESIEGIKTAKSYDALSSTPDVAVIAVPPPGGRRDRAHRGGEGHRRSDNPHCRAGP
jgi:acetyltransferase